MKQVQFATPTAYQRATTVDSTMFYTGSLMSFLAKSTETDGRFALMEFHTKPGNEPPPHIHLWEHELYFVLEGVLEFYCEDKVLLARPGEVVFLPQGKPHAFIVRTPLVRTLMLVVQGSEEHAVGLDSYFVEMAEPATSMNLPANAITYGKLDPDHASAVGAANGILLLSPEEAARELPLYPGFGTKRPLIGDVKEELPLVKS